jgi:hypothetical protein
MRRALLVAVTALLPSFAAGQEREWQSLFDGKSLGGWRETPFSGRGPVTVEGGALVLGPGGPLAGVTWSRSFPNTDYELRFQAVRLRGGDFFASVTFPVGKSFATWVTGGWGGDIVGLSSIDGWDASDNETRTYFEFDRGRWYSFRLQVKEDRIAAWIDEKQVFNVVIAGRSIGLRHGEIKLSAPLGFASYNTRGAVRNIEYRTSRR